MKTGRACSIARAAPRSLGLVSFMRLLDGTADRSARSSSASLPGRLEEHHAKEPMRDKQGNVPCGMGHLGEGCISETEEQIVDRVAQREEE